MSAIQRVGFLDVSNPRMSHTDAIHGPRCGRSENAPSQAGQHMFVPLAALPTTPWLLRLGLAAD
jgi:hypothetical protein